MFFFKLNVMIVNHNTSRSYTDSSDGGDSILTSESQSQSSVPSIPSLYNLVDGMEPRVTDDSTTLSRGMLPSFLSLCTWLSGTEREQHAVTSSSINKLCVRALRNILNISQKTSDPRGEGRFFWGFRLSVKPVQQSYFPILPSVAARSLSFST